MKKQIHLIFAAVVLALLMTGCKGHGIKDISVTSFKIVSLTPQGSTGLVALVEVGVHNPTVGFEVSDVSGLLNVKGQQALILTADQIVIDGNKDKTYTIPFKAYMADGFNPFSLLKLLNNELNFDELTVSIKAKVALRGGVGKNIEIKDKKLSDFIKKDAKDQDDNK